MAVTPVNFWDWVRTGPGLLTLALFAWMIGSSVYYYRRGGRAFEKNRAVLAEIARERGVTCVTSGRGKKVRFPLGADTVLISTFSRQSEDHRDGFVRFVLPCDREQTPRLVLKPRHLFSSVGSGDTYKYLRLTATKLDDPTFDRNFLLWADPPDRVRALLTPLLPTLRCLGDLNVTCNAGYYLFRSTDLTTGEVFAELADMELDAAKARQVLDLLTALSHSAEQTR